MLTTRKWGHGAHPHPVGPWEPASPPEVAAIFAGCQAPWWIAGGYAIQLAVGRTVREHTDIDVQVLRRDQLTVQQALPDWQWHAAAPPGSLRPWRPGERLEAGVHHIWCRPGPGQPWRIQIMLDESSADDWVSRRDPRIRRPITSLGRITTDGIPYLAPEIQLFYNAKAPQPKHETDFSAVLPILTGPQRQWLHNALRLTYGPLHPWCVRLRT
ncbi:MAG: amino acid transporter [Streptosporangiales bacterium]|nr:amino acid transporter [Streptosporangiales bacterium]